MHFLFRLDLSLHAGAGKKIRILIFATKRGLKLVGRQVAAEVQRRRGDHAR